MQYVTRKGQTWDEIAFELYGDEYKTDILMEANSQTIDIFVFDYGVVLEVPDLVQMSSASDKPPWR